MTANSYARLALLLALSSPHASNAFCTTCPPVSKPTILSRGHASRSATLAMAAPKFADFADLEAEVRSYLSTLDETALNDPAAPSPLAYLELQSAGRADLAEGCMKHGGYLAVSTKLGVRIQRKADAPPSGPMAPGGGAAVFGGDANPMAESAGVTLGVQAKEDKMAADLARLAAKSKTGDESAAEHEQPTTPSQQQPAAAPVDRLTPLKVSRTAKAAGGSAAVKGDGPLDGLGRYIRLDGIQRVESLLLIGLLAIGYGTTSSQVFDSGTQSTAMLVASVLLLLHVGLAGYGGFAVASGIEGEQSILWFLKILVTGVGGFLELKKVEGSRR